MGYYDEVLCHSKGEWKKHKYIRKEGKKYYYDRTVHDEESNTTWDYYVDPDTGEQVQVNRDYHPDRYSIDDFMSDMKELYGKRTLLSREEIEEAHNNVDPEPKKEEEKKYYAKHSEEDDDHLEHHGILGQKWGVRRFQDKSGHLTALGKSRVVNKTNKKHKFQDKSIEMNTRSNSVNAVLAVWGVTALESAAFSAATLSPLGALVALPHATLATGMTAALVKKDIDASIANKKEKKFKEERAQNPIDKKTGFHKKTTEMSASDDMERVNPAYKNWDENTKSNCVLCTMSMELRRRGYDVQARKATSGYNADNLSKDWFPGAKPKDSEGSMSDAAIIEYAKRGMPPKISKEQQKEMINNTMNEIRNQKNGARGQIAVTWDGTTSGHSIYYVNEGGKVVIYDTQANKRYEDKAAEKYLKKTSQVSVTRLDNCDLNVKYIKEVAE